MSIIRAVVRAETGDWRHGTDTDLSNVCLAPASPHGVPSTHTAGNKESHNPAACRNGDMAVLDERAFYKKNLSIGQLPSRLAMTVSVKPLLLDLKN